MLEIDSKTIKLNKVSIHYVKKSYYSLWFER